MKCARCGDTIIADVPGPFCSHCWDDFGEFLDEHPAGTEPRRMVADGGQEDEVWDRQSHNRNSESELSFVRIAHRINSTLMFGLIGLYLINHVVPDLGVPGLTTAFPYVAGLALIVLAVGIGMDTGALPADGSHGERGDQ